MTAMSKAFLLASGLLISAVSALADDAGKALYQRCAVCHQADGNGIPGIFPPLKNRLTKIVATAAGRDYLTMVLTEGLIATIDIDGVRYVGAMPAQQLSDTEVAEVIQYIATDFGQTGVTAAGKGLDTADVTSIRSKYSGDNATSAALLRTRVPLLNGH